MSEESLIGKRVNNYVIKSFLGEGGFGTVYLATNPTIESNVAIKVLSDAFSRDESVISRFINEAKSVNRINHRNIIKIFDFGKLEDGRHYFLMEFIDGRELEKEIKMFGHFSVSLASAVIEKICDGLEAAHRCGIIHRDLKPENVMFSRTAAGPEIKILDFGIAKLLEQPDRGKIRGETGQVIGTHGYMSPEQEKGESSEVDFQADIYACGVLLYKMLTGHLPYNGKTKEEIIHCVLEEPPVTISTYRDDLPSELDSFFSKALEKNPAERFQRVREFLNEWKKITVELGLASPAPGIDVSLTPVSIDDQLARQVSSHAGISTDSNTGTNSEIIGKLTDFFVKKIAGRGGQRPDLHQVSVIDYEDFSLLLPDIFQYATSSESFYKQGFFYYFDEIPVGAFLENTPLSSCRHIFESYYPRIKNYEINLSTLGNIEILNILEQRGDSKVFFKLAWEEVDTGIFNKISLLSNLRLYLELPPNFPVNYFEDLTRLTNLEGLICRGCEVTDETAVFLSQIPSIEYLDLSETMVTSRSMAGIGRMKNLKHLILKNTTINDEGIKFLSESRKLKTLDLTGTKVTDSCSVYLNNMTMLNSLVLKNCRISDRFLKNIPGKTIRLLNLYGTDISDRSAKVMEKFEALRSLNISHSRISDKLLEGISGLRNLKKLDMKYTSTGDNSVSSIKNLRSLRWIGVSKTGITDDFIQGISSCEYLIYLDASLNDISDRSFAYLADLASLQHLDLSSTRISSRGLLYLPKLENLNSLNLKKTVITDEAFEYIKKLSSLRVLNISGCSISDRICDYLPFMEKLRTINLADTLVSVNKIKEMRLVHPSVNILRFDR
ncbi:protein kinase [Myxococcota bacterium]|nr:protein kinase [Myxococcota bacterium]MBU1379355.1 protein kinase [Myxococcota bacterium]MBU1497041.1 protein kinase [Myxococcota bacterium]